MSPTRVRPEDLLEYVQAKPWSRTARDYRATREVASHDWTGFSYEWENPQGWHGWLELRRWVLNARAERRTYADIAQRLGVTVEKVRSLAVDGRRWRIPI